MKVPKTLDLAIFTVMLDIIVTFRVHVVYKYEHGESRLVDSQNSLPGQQSQKTGKWRKSIDDQTQPIKSFKNFTNPGINLCYQCIIVGNHVTDSLSFF